MIVRMRIAGFGGQGVLTAGVLCATAGMNTGRYVTWYPSYGAEMRGGTANCSVKIGDEEIDSPYLKGVDILCAMNTPSIDAFQDEIEPGGIMIVDSDSADAEYAFREDIRVVQVPINEFARKAENPRGANIVMLGALVANTDLFDFVDIASAIESYFGKKGISPEKNLECLRLGAGR